MYTPDTKEESERLYGIVYNVLNGSMRYARLEKIKNHPDLVWEGTKRECSLFWRQMGLPLKQLGQIKNSKKL